MKRKHTKPLVKALQEHLDELAEKAESIKGDKSLLINQKEYIRNAKNTDEDYLDNLEHITDQQMIYLLRVIPNANDPRWKTFEKLKTLKERILIAQTDT